MDLLNVVCGLQNVDVEDMKKLIECPVCLDIPIPPIYLCKRGHIVCNACQEKTVVCPLCRDNFSNTRSFVAEGIVEKCTMRCKFSDQGCPGIMTGAEVMGHLRICPYRPLRCLDCGGRWINSGDYMSHLYEFHAINGTDQPDGHVVYNMCFSAMVMSGKCKYVWPPYYFKAFGQTFFLRLHCIKNNICAYVFGHGDPIGYENYEALIQLYSPLEKKAFEISWKGEISHSRDDPYADVLIRGRGLILPTETVRALAVVRSPETLPEWCYYIKIQEVDKNPKPENLKNADLECKIDNDTLEKKRAILKRRAYQRRVKSESKIQTREVASIERSKASGDASRPEE